MKQFRAEDLRVRPWVFAGRGGIEWRTLLLMPACYLAWAAAGWLYAAAPWAAIPLLAFVIAFHSSLQHEALHGHPTRWAAVNEALVFLPIGLTFPYRRYKRLHLRHHADERLTDPYEDPESYYFGLREWQALPRPLKLLLRWNNSLLVRIWLGPAITLVGFALSEFKVLAASRDARKAWLLHGAGMVPTLLAVVLLFRVPIWAYLMSVYLGLSLIGLRSFCEHQWSENPDRRTVIVENSWLGWLFLNNTLHLVHHKHPAAPWYDLPGLYRSRRREWREMNDGYVLSGYIDVLRRFGMRPKEPVVHPGATGVARSR